MKTRTLNFTTGAALVLAALLTAPAARAQTKAAPPAKATFVSKKHGFSLYLPQKPMTLTRPKPAILGGGTLEAFGVAPAPVSYSIVPLVLPAVANDVSQKVYFDSVQQGVLQSSGGKALSSRNLRVNGQTTRAFAWTFSAPTKASKQPVKFAGETRIYKIGPRAYQFTALVPVAQLAASRAQINKVFGSILIAK